MPSIALSLSQELERFGAYAGLLAFFGFAVLIILYFAQAREVKRLREWAGRAPERAAELEARVAADAARRAASPPRQGPGPPGPATAAGATGGAAGSTAAPAATAAPPAPAGPGNGAAAGTSEPGEGSEAPAGEGPASGGEPSAAPAGPDSGTPAPTDAPTSDEVAPAGNGAASPPTVPPIPRATPDAPPVGAPPPRRPSPAAGLRQPPPPSRRPGPPPARRPPAPPEDEGSNRTRTAIIAVSGLVAVVFAVLAAMQIFGGGEEPTPPNVPAPAEQTATPAGEEEETTETASEPSRGDTTVAVLNGTTVTGLAAQIADDIEQAGFLRGATANYSDQARSASLVFYEGEFRRRAQEVARIVDLPAEDVEPATDDVRSLAGDADVVVVVGADQAP